MDLKKEQIIKSKLGLILKVLLIAIAIFKLTEYILGRQALTGSDQENESMTVVDSVAIKGVNVLQEDKALDDQKKELTTPEANSASIYIFGANGLDSQASRHIGEAFFNEYKLKANPQDFKKEQLLLGNLDSSANTELVCVGVVNYSYIKDDQKTSCEVSLNFDTYNKVTGEKVKHLSKSMLRFGIGFSNTQAKQVALGKVHP